MNVGFVGLGVHLSTTKSSQFFLDLLKCEWPDIDVWTHDQTWLEVIKKKRWDLLVYWQHLPPRWEIDAIGPRRTVLVPMFDASPTDQASWEVYRGIPILSFSKHLGELLHSWGHDVRIVSFATPVPKISCDWGGGLRAFFWPRTHELTWLHVSPLLRDGMSIHLHFTRNLHRDHRLVAPSAEETSRYQVTMSEWFESSEDLEKAMATRNVYFAPRRSEGIGMSYQEALGLGMAVIAPNGPTMNEVICHGVDGWLYDPDHAVVPDWTQARDWGESARRKHIARRKAWEDSVPETVQFLTPQGVWPARRYRFRRLCTIVLELLRSWIRPRFLSFKRVIKIVIGHPSTRAGTGNP